MNEILQPKCYQAPDNIGKALKPFFKRLHRAWEDCAGSDKRYYRDLLSNIRVAQNNIADNSSFLYFMMNIFKPGCMSHISVRHSLAIPLSLMLVLKYIRGTEKREKALLISLSHPMEIVENLVAYCLRKSVMPLLNGKIRDQDWPRLTSAASDIYELGLDFWKEGVFFEADHLKRIIELSEMPFGLVVINDAIGQLDQDSHGTISPVQQLMDIRFLATELKLPVIIIDSSFKEEIVSADVFDHAVQLSDEVDRYQMSISNSVYGTLTFFMSHTCNILEDALSNFTQTRPTNYN